MIRHALATPIPLLESRSTMSKTTDPEKVTRLLQEWSRGEAGALDRLIPLVFDDLRQMARRHFYAEPDDHTLQPTALVNEVYLRLCKQRQVQWEKREQFFAFAATLMRRILIDSAKARKAERRGNGIAPLPLDEAIGVAAVNCQVDIEALDQALVRLKAIDPRQAEIVDLRYFLGLTNEEIAEHLGISVSTVKREWQLAKIWLRHELCGVA
jgi:RNA polymerase sigma factor (TIGR02999 family)